MFPTIEIRDTNGQLHKVTTQSAVAGRCQQSIAGFTVIKDTQFYAAWDELVGPYFAWQLTPGQHAYIEGRIDQLKINCGLETVYHATVRELIRIRGHLKHGGPFPEFECIVNRKLDKWIARQLEKDGCRVAAWPDYTQVFIRQRKYTETERCRKESFGYHAFGKLFIASSEWTISEIEIWSYFNVLDTIRTTKPSDQQFDVNAMGTRPIIAIPSISSRVRDMLEYDMFYVTKDRSTGASVICVDAHLVNIERTIYDTLKARGVIR